MLSFFPRDVLDEIWDLIESVSEGFPSYSYRDRRTDARLIAISPEPFGRGKKKVGKGGTNNQLMHDLYFSVN